MWAIMKEFKILPTDERFQALSDEQIGFILESMVLDNKEQARASKGLDSKDYFEDEDESFWDVPLDEFTALKEEHDEEDIARQVEELMGKDSIRKARERFKSTEEYNDYLEKGGKLARQMEIDSYIEDRLKAVYEEAQEIEALKADGKEVKRVTEQPTLKPMEVDTIQEAIKLFNGDDEDDDFYI